MCDIADKGPAVGSGAGNSGGDCSWSLLWCDADMRGTAWDRLRLRLARDPNSRELELH